MTDHLNSAHDDRLDPGMAAQAERRRDAESGGAEQVGWKAGLGTTTWRERFGLTAPLVGFLLDTSRDRPGAHVEVGTWISPYGEAEIAMRVGDDVPGDATPGQALAAVDAIAPAIELIDLDPLPTDPVEALAGNIFHRRWITGTFDSTRAGGDVSGLVGHITVMDETLAPVTELEIATGPAGEVLAEVARIAARHGRGLRAGDIVLLGSVVPPVAIAPYGTMHYVLGDAPALEVTFTGR
jgi:2-keto-4-pentenoate hydratase